MNCKYIPYTFWKSMFRSLYSAVLVGILSHSTMPVFTVRHFRITHRMRNKLTWLPTHCCCHFRPRLPTIGGRIEGFGRVECPALGGGNKIEQDHARVQGDGELRPVLATIARTIECTVYIRAVGRTFSIGNAPSMSRINKRRGEKANGNRSGRTPA